MDAHDLSEEALEIKPQKILIIGTLGSGKTTVAQRLARDTGFPYASIDSCRIRYGDGTVEGEERAWENFLAICRKPAPGILEFCGMGPHVVEVRDNLLCSTVPVSVIWLVLPLDTCIARASQRQKKIPVSIPMGTCRIFCAAHPRWNRYFLGYHMEPGITFSCNTAGIFRDCFC